MNLDHFSTIFKFLQYRMQPAYALLDLIDALGLGVYPPNVSSTPHVLSSEVLQLRTLFQEEEHYQRQLCSPRKDRLHSR